VSRVPLGYPHEFFAKPLVQTFSFGGVKELIDVA